MLMISKPIVSFLLSSLIHMIIIVILMFVGSVLVFGLFDSTSSIQEFEVQKYQELILYLSISLILIIITIFVLKFEKKFRIAGGIITIIIVSLIQIFEYQAYSKTKQFEQSKWHLSESDKFKEARSIVIKESFRGFDKERVVANLGSPNNSESNYMDYDINYIFNWTLRVNFDSCCVMKTEFIKDPWHL